MSRFILQSQPFLLVCCLQMRQLSPLTRVRTSLTKESFYKGSCGQALKGAFKSGAADADRQESCKEFRKCKKTCRTTKRSAKKLQRQEGQSQASLQEGGTPG